MTWYFRQVYGPLVTDILQSCKVLLFIGKFPLHLLKDELAHAHISFFTWKGVFGRWKVLNFGKMVTVFYIKTKFKRKPQITSAQKQWSFTSLSSGMSYTQDVRKSLPDSFGGPTYRSGYIHENKWILQGMDIKDPHSWKGKIEFEDPSCFRWSGC